MTLADIPVAAKLAIILVLPLAAVLALTGVAASGYAAQSGRIGDLRGAVAAGAEAGRVADGLQRERLAIARLLSGAGDGALDAFAAEAARTDAAVARFRALLPRAGGAPGIVAGLDGLAVLRARAAAREPDAPGQVLLLGYRQLIADLVAFQQGIADRPAPPAVTAATRAAGWLAVAREELALVQVGAARALAAGELTPADRDQLVEHRAAAADAFGRFAADATPAWRAQLAGLDVTADVEQLLLAPPAAATDTADWARTCLAQLDGLRGLADRVAADNAAEVTDARDRQNRMIILGLALVLAVTVAAVGVAVAVGRSVRRGLRALHSGALQAAHPARDTHPAGEGPPVREGAAGRDGVELPAGGRDEIGRVTEAFNAVQRETARAVAEQAALRAGMTGVYADLARRSARLADALLERLDDAERDEVDPDRLALLFAFDHLATRIRHNTQRLLVLAGADTARDHGGPVRLFDVLRAAQSQIQAYQRVDYGRVDDDVAVEPAAVDGVVHLLAELLDNAASHSTADRPVVVDARRTGDGVVIHVADRGPGVDLARLEELNGRLDTGGADPPASGPRLGLAVVARLAARHGLDVTLQPSAGSDGLVATVRLPSSLLCEPAPVPVSPAPVMSAPVVSAPVVSAPVVSAPAVSAPAVSAPAVPTPVAPAPVAPAVVARSLPPRLLERSPALPGGEPMDIPHPRKDSGRIPVAPVGVAADGPTVEARAFDDGLPRRTVNASPHADSTADESDDVSALLSTYQHAIGRFGAVPVPVNQEGHSSS
ncbi:sensor histidine kinase [Dactylosporangium sp. NPDC049525]|uniref:sensor histidine kinase n=1 Tax=Dactylosporangium sp. NPDC049525 TaxID=3154730 RepID=UPI00343A415B